MNCAFSNSDVTMWHGTDITGIVAQKLLSCVEGLNLTYEIVFEKNVCP